VVDEMVGRFTHTIENDLMLPGIPPTGKRVEIALVVVAQFDGDKLSHEHLYWDQASVLVQLGLIDSEGLPVVGAESARSVLDRNIPLNALIRCGQADPHRTSRRGTEFSARASEETY
jgi:carboxymethylenebutenolidase